MGLDRWALLVKLFPEFKETHSLGSPVEPAFSAKLQRKLASTIPPRPVIQLSFEKAYQDFAQLHADVQEAFLVLQFEEENCIDRWDRVTVSI